MITASVLSTLNELILISTEVTIENFHDLFQLLVDNLQDMGFADKRIQAAKCLSTIIRVSGLVIYVNYRYPWLTELILALYQNETKDEAKQEIMRLMGCLGALDCYNLFEIKNHGNRDRVDL